MLANVLYAYGRAVELASSGQLLISRNAVRNAFWGRSGRNAKPAQLLGPPWTCTSCGTSPGVSTQPGYAGAMAGGTYGHVGFEEEVNADKHDIECRTSILLARSSTVQRGMHTRDHPPIASAGLGARAFFNCQWIRAGVILCQRQATLNNQTRSACSPSGNTSQIG